MRPRGEVRQAVASAAGMLAQRQGSFTGREVAGLAQVGFEKARLTLKDMVRAEEIVVVGETRAPGVCRPLNVYAPATPRATPGADLMRVVQCWADFR